ncbi:MAG: hypothetical protein KatS3mg009_0952 [Acidimicrobiia bacterium]|nr:MAG: hypothetical protein KatS3mg009_0952 [Acidimicrobiia bacterium]
MRRLLADPGIVRHRGKIEATIENARAVLRVRDELGSFAALVWSFAPARRRGAPRRLADLASTTPESEALSRELRRRGFRFVGPTTVHAAMQACGLVNDHLARCHARPGCAAERAAVTVPAPGRTTRAGRKRARDSRRGSTPG